MNLTEQNIFRDELEEFLKNKLKGGEFQAIIANVDNEGGFAFSISNLNEASKFQNCDLIVTAIADEADELLRKFRIPSYNKLKKPVEPR